MRRLCPHRGGAPSGKVRAFPSDNHLISGAAFPHPVPAVSSTRADARAILVGMPRRRLLAAALVLASAGIPAGVHAAAAGPPSPPPRLAGCPVFPASSAWNRDVSRDPVDPRSEAWVRSIGRAGRLHPDFGSGRLGNYGIPITVASSTQPARAVRFTAYADESDRGPYAIPARARVEGGGDRHVLVVQRGRCRLYELYDAHALGGGRWSAASGAIWDLRSNHRRPAGWTSADAAGLPITPGLARPDEASAGTIRHALRFTAPRTRRAYVAPARHQAGASDDPALPPMGARLRLKAAFDLRGYHGQSLAILRALKRYGMLLADNGSPWFISGAADRRWNDADLEQLKRVPASAFEAVRAGPLAR